MYHLDHGFGPSTLNRMVKALLKAYASKVDQSGPTQVVRTRCSALLMMELFCMGLQSSEVNCIGWCAMKIFAFVFQCSVVSVAHVKPEDIIITSQEVTVRLTRGKEKSFS